MWITKPHILPERYMKQHRFIVLTKNEKLLYFHIEKALNEVIPVIFVIKENN